MQQYLGTLGHCLATLLASLVALSPLVAMFYIGRELTQAEYRYISAHGGKRYDCPWYCGVLPSAWTFKGMLDWMLPTALAVLAFILFPHGILTFIM